MKIKLLNVFRAFIIISTVLIVSQPFWKQTKAVINNENTCICAFDGFGYYMYLPALVQNGNLNMSPQWAQQQQNNYCNGIFAYQLSQRENGNHIDVYHMGLAVIQSPSFLIGHVFAKTSGFPADGMSKPYLIAFVLNAWLFAILGVFFSLKLFQLFFNGLQSALLTFIVILGTNYWLTTTLSYTLQHHYLFALIAAFVFFVLRYHRTGKGKWIPAILLGLIVLIRPTHIFLGIIPLVIFHDRNKSFKQWIKQLTPYLICGFLWQVPQLLYWKIIGGSWFLPNLHVEEVILKDPHLIDFLFSFRKGWLIYTPLFLLLPIGLFVIRKNQNQLYKALVVTLIVEIWTMASWECWWYASSFGQRPMVDLYPILAIPLGFILFKSGKWWKHLTLGIFVFGCIVLNLFQSEQLIRGQLSPDRMTKDHFFYIFGKTDIPNYNEHRLLINRDDLNWVNLEIEYKKLGYHFEKKQLFTLRSKNKVEAVKSLSVTNLPLYNHLKTDESQLSVNVSWKSDANSMVELRCETGNIHNNYSWKTFLLPPTNHVWKDSVFHFNLADQHHSYDELAVYFVNNSNQHVWVKNIQINSISLIRNPKK